MYSGLHHIGVISRRELRAYFDSPVGYVFLVVFLVSVSWLYLQGYFIEGQVSMRGFFELLPWMFLFLIPAVTMRLWAEEKKQGTIETLFTLPVRTHDIVIGKFVGSTLFIAIALVLTFPITIVVAYTGSPDWGVIIGSYVSSLLLAASGIALGMWISSLTRNQIIAFVVSVFALLLLMIIGEEFFLSQIPEVLRFVQSLSLSSHFASMARGVIDTRDIIYYLSFICVFLYLNTLSLKRS